MTCLALLLVGQGDVDTCVARGLSPATRERKADWLCKYNNNGLDFVQNLLANLVPRAT